MAIRTTLEVSYAAFALYFSGSAASLSTSHLYISALATWSQNLDSVRDVYIASHLIPSSVTSVAFSRDSLYLR